MSAGLQDISVAVNTCALCTRVFVILMYRYSSVCVLNHTHPSLRPSRLLLAKSPIIPLVHATKRPPSAACGPSEREAPSRRCRRRRRRHYCEAWRPRGSGALPLNPKHGAVCVVVVLLCLLSCVQIDALHKQHAGCLGWQRRRLLIMFSMPSIQSHGNWSWSRGLWEWSEW